MAKDTLEALLEHDIQYYATINFQGLKDAVDAIEAFRCQSRRTL